MLHFLKQTGFILSFCLLFLQGNSQQSDYEDSLQAVLENDMHDTLRANIYLDLSDYYKSIGRYEQAYEYYYQFITFEDSAKIQLEAERLEIAQAKFETQKKEDEYLLQQKDNEIQQYNLDQHDYYIYSLLIAILLIILISYLIYNSKKIKSNRRIIEISQRNLRQQLNPEFIYKTLNSIQYSLFSNDRKSSHQNLSKFAKLMRQILDNSQHKYISIQKELESLRLFLDLETFRLRDRFEYSIEVDNRIDTIEQKIPPQILHSFIEKMILKGNYESVIGKRIDIRLILEVDSIICRIDELVNDQINISDRISEQNMAAAPLEFDKSMYKDIKILNYEKITTNNMSAGKRVDIHLFIKS